MKISVSLLLLVFTSAFFLSNCKKGEEDPIISFRSRKERLAGDWSLKSGNAALTKAPYNQNFSFTSTKLECNQTESGGPAIIYVGSYSLIFSVKKDGTFNFRENLGGSLLEGSGRWNFKVRSKDSKNKEEVTFTIDETTKGNIDEHVFNQLQKTFTYRLVELRNKDLQIEALDKSFTFSNGVNVNFSSRYTLMQR